MKKIFLLISMVLTMVVTSCIDDLNQHPIIETDATAVYSEA